MASQELVGDHFSPVDRSGGSKDCVSLCKQALKFSHNTP